MIKKLLFVLTGIGLAALAVKEYPALQRELKIAKM